MKKVYALLLAFCLLLSGCSMLQPADSTPYNATYLDLFDTVTTILGTEGPEDAFRETAQNIYQQLHTYHQLFDIYHEYEGVTNLKTVNDNAGIAPVQVDAAIIRLLQECREYYRLTGGNVNVAMGSVLRLWHEARSESLQDPENARLPDPAVLKAAAQHTDINSIVIDEEASTVYISDPEASLDVGAIAKGWAAQQVAEKAPAGLLISVGGNVCITGPKDKTGTPWSIGIQDPADSSRNLHTLKATCGAAVTSGDYQRAFTVEGKAYHHIIDPQTQMPAAYWRSVTVVCPDSALADAMSTALFLLPLEEGLVLAGKCDVQALWVDKEGNESMTPGFREWLQ